MATKKKVTEEVKDTAKKVSATAAAKKTEAKKAVSTAAAKTKATAAETKAKAEAKKPAAKKPAAKAAPAPKAEKKPAAKPAVKKPAAKAAAGKVNLVFESLLGGVITPEAIIKMLPKEAVSAYVKIEENAIYWVGKNGETGSIEIW